VIKRGLTFTAGNHQYRLDGKHVPGVTTILGVLEKPAISKWAAKSVAEYVASNPDQVEALRQMGERSMVAALKDVPWQQRDEGANRGSEVHRYAERIIHGEELEVGDQPGQVPVLLEGHVESCVRFLDEWQIRAIEVERVVASREHWYAGRFDVVADSSRTPRAIWDYKTARSGIYYETAYQLTAYSFAEFYVDDAGMEIPMPSLGIETAYGVWIRADGYEVVPVAFGPDVFEEYVAIRKVFAAVKKAAGDWKRPGTGYVGLAIQENEEVWA
jgi:hypothetical protein